MNWQELWAKTVEVAGPILLAVLVPYVIALLKQRIGQVKDERLRALLLDIVTAVEKNIPEMPDAPEKENVAKHVAAQSLAKEVLGRKVADYQISAAVGTMKGVY